METFDVNVRRATTLEDMESVKAMIQELADFENMSNEPKLVAADLFKDSGSNGKEQEFFHCYLAEIIPKNIPEEENLQKEQIRSSKCDIVGYAVCFFCYSTWEGKSYFLEDLFVRPTYRKLGIGRKLFTTVASMARQYNCSRLQFHVLDWNPARKFYEKLGATNLTSKEGWHLYGLNRGKLNEIHID